MGTVHASQKYGLCSRLSHDGARIWHSSTVDVMKINLAQHQISCHDDCAFVTGYFAVELACACAKKTAQHEVQNGLHHEIKTLEFEIVIKIFSGFAEEPGENGHQPLAM